MEYTWTRLSHEEIYGVSRERPELFVAEDWVINDEDDDLPEASKESSNFAVSSTTTQEILQLQQPNRSYPVFLDYPDKLSIAAFNDELSFRFSEEDDYLVKKAFQFNTLLKSQGLTYQNCLDAKLEGTLGDLPEDKLAQKINELVNSIVHPPQPRQERLSIRIIKSLMRLGLRK